MDLIPEQNSLQSADTDPTAHQTKAPWVVGIGAGAGGLEAIQLLFGAMPVDAEPAFIICRHVQSGLSDPLADLLCTQTSMPVVQAESGTIITPGHIHLVAPDARMILLKDRLVPFPPETGEEPEGGVSPIDVLLHSLAASAGPAAIAIMLSGKDEDGLRGCMSIRNHGGIVLAQHPESTEFAEMPRRVIEAGLASATAPPGALAGLIRRHTGKGQKPKAQQDDARGEDEAFSKITALLQDRFALDPRAYRPTLVAKRVRRRLAMSSAATLVEYAGLLSSDNGELSALHDDLLIRVTSFFRDPEAFKALEEEIIPGLVERMSPDQPIRIWVPACATGEESYSLAMLMLDRIDRASKAAHFDIIASDRHIPSIEHGRLGRYAGLCLDSVPPDLAHRFLSDDGEGLEVDKRLSRHVTFVEHDLLKTPPPDDIDLISCRNLLIYLSSAAREKVLLACHDALTPGGFLFLGPSEQPGSQASKLNVINGKWRIYQKPAAPPVDEALTRLSAAHRQRPAEPILPASQNDAGAGVRSSRSEPPALDVGPDDDVSHMLLEHQRMLESTIDTLLSSNETLRRRNQNLRAENQRLAHTHNALDDIATMIAHDLKTPLYAIENEAERLKTLLSADKAGQTATYGLQAMRDRLAALNQVIDDLLAYAREAPADMADLSSVDFADLLRETLMLVGLPKGIRVEIKPPSLRIKTWRIPLACILRTLLAQAIERIGDASGTIRIDATPKKKSLHLAIIDNGRHAIDRRGDLGLAIVRRFLETAGGKMAAGAAQFGVGYRTSFNWPIKESAVPKTAEETASST